MHTHIIAAPETREHIMARGFRLAYNEADSTPMSCPGCGHTNWLVGRVTAECAFCETALPLEHIHSHGYTPRFVTSSAMSRRTDLSEKHIMPAFADH